jgi:hypothetical protein
MAIAILASICGASGFDEIVEFGQAKGKWLGTFLALPRGIPSSATFERVFAALNPDAFEACFRLWITAVAGAIEGVLAIDGKTLRDSLDRANGKSAIGSSGWARCARDLARPGTSQGCSTMRKNSGDIAALQAGLKQRKLARSGVRLYTADFDSMSLCDFYRGRSAFLMLSGPSLNQIDLAQLNRRGIVTMAVRPPSCTLARSLPVTGLSSRCWKSTPSRPIASLAVTEFMKACTGLALPTRLIRYDGRLSRVTVRTDPPMPDCYYCAAVRGAGTAADVERYLRKSDGSPLSSRR